MHKIARRLLYALALAAVVTALSAAGITSGAFGGFQRRSSDALFPSAQTDPRVVVVGIDPDTVKRVGQIPLPRSTDADLGDALARAGAAVVVWDLIFNAPREGDDALARAFAEPPATVLAEAVKAERTPSGVFRVTSGQGPHAMLTTAPNTSIGHTLVTPDPTDGVIRTLPLVVEDNARIVPSLALEAFQALYGETGAVTVRPDGVQVGGRSIPTEGDHLLRLNFAPGLAHVNAVRVVSAAKVLEGKFPKKLFRNKVVFIGATDPTLGDTKLVPVDKSSTFPGVLIHANALNTMLTASYLEPVSDTEATLWTGMLALIVALAVLFLPVWASLVIVLLLLGVPPVVPGGYLLLSYVRFDEGQVMNIIYPLAALVLTFFGGLAVRYLTETRQRRRVSSLFAQYVPEAVAKQLEESGALESHIEGERVDVGLFFCDLRGFTSLSATLEPSEVRAMLNHFYDLLTQIIHAHKGTVLKFVGDEVFAVFGAPLPLENNAQATLDCAMEIQQRAPELDAELADLGIPPVKFGIGMNAGAVVAAHIGGGRRRQYDIVGDTVNLGSRLCGQAGKGEIVLPESMITRFDHQPEMESMGAVQLKGLEQPVPLFKVTVGESEPRQAAPAGAAPRS